MAQCVTPWEPNKRTQEAIEKIKLDSSQEATSAKSSATLPTKKRFERS